MVMALGAADLDADFGAGELAECALGADRQQAMVLPSQGRVPDVLARRDTSVPYPALGGGGAADGGKNFEPQISTLEASPVRDTFFSSMNVGVLQHCIAHAVLRASQGQDAISRQSDTELRLVMRSVYLQYGRNVPFDVAAQVRELNQHVLDFAVPNIRSAVALYRTFQRDIASPIQPLDRGEYVSSKGTKNLR